LIVCSLMMSAGIIVFVNRTEQFQQTVTAVKDQMAAMQHQNQEQLNEANALRTDAEAKAVAADAQAAGFQKDLSTAQQTLAERGVQLAETNKNLSLAQVQLAGVSQAMRASESTKAKLLAEQEANRGQMDRLTRGNSDLNARVSDLTNQLDVTERDRKYLSEQLSEAQSQVASQSAALKNAGVSPQQAAATPATPPAMNGTVTGIKPINGIQYATISIGTSQGVQPGTEFKVIDQEKGEFLGTLKIDTVEPNEAIGRLEGPRVGDIHPGNQVRTQL
jgi:chromosome segregation ATPase